MKPHSKAAQHCAYVDMKDSDMRILSQSKVLSELPIEPTFSSVPKPFVHSPEKSPFYAYYYQG